MKSHLNLKKPVECINPSENADSTGIIKSDEIINRSNAIRHVLGKALFVLTTLSGATGCGGNVTVTETNVQNLADGGDAEEEDANSTDSADTNNDGDVHSDAINEGNEECNIVKITPSAENPQTTSLPRGSTNVPLLCFELHPGCEPGVLNKFEFIETNKNNTGDEVRVTLAAPPSGIGGARFTPFKKADEASFDNIDEEIEGVEPKYQDGVSYTYCLYGNVSPNAVPFSEYSFELVKPDPSFMTNQPKVQIDQPIKSATFTVGNANIGTFIAEEVTSVPQQYLAPGESGHIAGIALGQGPSTTSRMRRVTLKIDGTCDLSTIKNLRLSAGADDLSGPNWQIDKKGLVHFPVNFNPYDLFPGLSTTLYVHADQGCKSGEYISVYLDEPSDFYVEDLTYGFGESIQKNSWGKLCGNGPNCKPSIVYIK